MKQGAPAVVGPFWKDVAIFLSVVLGGVFLSACYWGIWGRIEFAHALVAPVWFLEGWWSRGPVYPIFVLPLLLLAGLVGIASRKTWLVVAAGTLIVMAWVFLQWIGNNVSGVSY